MVQNSINAHQILDEVRNEFADRKPRDSNTSYRTEGRISGLNSCGSATLELVEPLVVLERIVEQLGQKIGMELTHRNSNSNEKSVTVTFGDPEDPYGKKFQLRAIETFDNQRRQVAYYTRLVNVDSEFRYEFPPLSGDLRSTIRSFSTFLVEERYVPPARRDPAPVAASLPEAKS